MKSGNAFDDNSVSAPLLNCDRTHTPKPGYGSHSDLSTVPHTIINIRPGFFFSLCDFYYDNIFAHIFNFLNFEETYAFIHSSFLLRFDQAKADILCHKTIKHWLSQASNISCVLGAVGSIIESKIANEAVGQYKNIFYHWEKSKDKLVSYFNDKDAELESHQHFLTSGPTQRCQEYVRLVSALSTPFVYDSGSFLYALGSSCKLCPLILMMFPVGGFVSLSFNMIYYSFNPKTNVSHSDPMWEFLQTSLILILTYLSVRIMSLCIGYRKGKRVMSQLISRYEADMQTYRRLTPAKLIKYTDVELFEALKLSDYQSRNEQHWAPVSGCSK